MAAARTLVTLDLPTCDDGRAVLQIRQIILRGGGRDDAVELKIDATIYARKQHFGISA